MFSEQSSRSAHDLRAKHEWRREEARRELGIPDPKLREQERQPEPEQPKAQPEPKIETDRYGNEIIDMSGPVEPEASHDEPPPLEPDTYVPDHHPPEHDFDFEMGD